MELYQASQTAGFKSWFYLPIKKLTQFLLVSTLPPLLPSFHSLPLFLLLPFISFSLLPLLT